MEFQRLEALKKLEILDSGDQEAFDRITALVSSLYDAPISLISLVDEDRQWFKSSCGLETKETPRSIAFCNIAIQSDHILYVPDVSLDERFADNPLVTGEPYIRAYVGAPLVTSDGFRLGTLCAIFKEPRTFSQKDFEPLQSLSKTVIDLLELRAQANASDQAAIAHHKVSQRLRDQSALLSEISEMALIGGWEFDLRAEQVTWSDGTRNIHEVADDFMPDLESAIAFYSPEGRMTVETALDEAIQKQTSFDYVTQIVTAKGRTKWVRAVGRPVVVNGEVTKLYGAFQDVTLDRERENALGEERLRLASIIEATGVGTWEWDAQTGHVEYNEAWCSMIGYTKAEMRPDLQQWEELVHPEDFHHTRADFEAHLKGGAKRYTATFRMRHKQGHWVWISTIGGVSVQALDGTPMRVVGAHTDITEQRERESFLRDQKLAAEAASVAKSQFLATMSHEIRTPMNGVMGMLNILRDTDLSASQQEYVDVAYQSADDLLRILNDVLDISKLEAGEPEIEAVPFSLGKTIEAVVDLFRASADEKGIGLITDVSLPPALIGDPTRCRQIISNLISNAIKFTHDGHVSVMALYNEEKSRVILEVSDTGIGMDASFMDRIFERFSQADPSHARQYGGTGLGMAICKQLTQLMDGDITCDSVPGEGTTFTVHLSAARAEVPQPAHETVTEVPPITTLEPLRILAVDDQPVNQKIIQAYMKPHGHTVVAAMSGVEAIQALDSASFDLILMDIQMPEMDGPTAMRAIRNRSSDDRNVPIIALTANAMKGDEEAYIKAGADGYVTKPVKPEALLEAMARAMTVGKARAEVITPPTSALA